MDRPVPAPASLHTGMSSPASRFPLPLLLLLISINLFWAGSSLAAKVALVSIPPMTLAFTRFSLAALLLYGFAITLKVDLRVARRDWGAFWGMGILGVAFVYVLAYQGLRLTTVSAFALLHAGETVFLSALAFAFLREAMPRVRLLGILAGLIGVFLIVANGFTPGWPVNSVQGNFLIALALAFEAGASIVGKGLMARYRTLTVVTYQLFSGAIALAPFCLYELVTQKTPSALPPASALWSLLYLILPCTVFGYLVWFTVLDKRKASEVSVFLFIQPLAGAFLGAYFEGDKITGLTVIGALLILLAIFLVNFRPWAALPPLAPPSA